MKYKKAVSFGAHTLDAELLAGPLFIELAKQGTDCYFINMTQGRLMGADITQEEKDAYQNDLLSQNQRVSATMGAKSFWFEIDSLNMPTMVELTNKVKAYLLDEQIDLVITHWGGSLHDRHNATHEAVTKAVKMLRLEGHYVELYYGETFEDLHGFTPHKYLSFDEETIETWFKALKHYDIFNGHVNNLPYEQWYRTNLFIRRLEAARTKDTTVLMCASLPTTIDKI